VSRVLLWGFLLAYPLAGHPQLSTRPAPTVEQEPPEEDPDLKPREYSFNPVEAARNVTAGNFYYKKGNYRAAFRRYVEAGKWDPTSGEVQLKLAAAAEKLHDSATARTAYTKYLEIDPDSKDSQEVKKKLAKLPPVPLPQKKQ